MRAFRTSYAEIPDELEERRKQKSGICDDGMVRVSIEFAKVASDDFLGRRAMDGPWHGLLAADVAQDPLKLCIILVREWLPLKGTCRHGRAGGDWRSGGEKSARSFNLKTGPLCGPVPHVPPRRTSWRIP